MAKIAVVVSVLLAIACILLRDRLRDPQIAPCNTLYEAHLYFTP
jgi:hypothetical protein